MEEHLSKAEAQEQAAAEPKPKAARKARQREFRFFAIVRHRQIDMTTNQTPPAELLEFSDKVSMRAALASPNYETAEVRVIRGYELNVKSKRSVSIN